MSGLGGRMRGECLVSSSRELRIVLVAGVAVLTVRAFAQDGSTTLPEIRVIATTPLSTVSRSSPPTVEATPTPARDPTLIDRDKVPSNTQSLTAEDFSRTYSTSATDALMQRVPGVSTTDV